MVSAYNTRNSARPMGAQAVSALQLLEAMQSLELTPTGAPTIRRSVPARMAGNADPVAGRLRAPAGRKPPLPRVDPGIQAAAWQQKTCTSSDGQAVTQGVSIVSVWSRPFQTPRVPAPRGPSPPTNTDQ